MYSNQEVIKYLNLVREYPKYYLTLLQQQITSFHSQQHFKIDDLTVYEAIEGKSAWIEAKQFLSQQPPIRPLQLHEGLTKAANDHLNDIALNNCSGHQGTDGSTFIDRINRHCKKGKGSMIELIGTIHKITGKNSIELSILNLIIDDGVQNRGHRKAIFNNDYRYVGVCLSDVNDRVISVITMAETNLQSTKDVAQSIATSTSHLKTYSEINSQQDLKENLSVIQRRNIGNSHEFISSFTSPFKQIQPTTRSKVERSEQQKPEHDYVWTLKNVNDKPKSQKGESSKQNIELYAEPSIMKGVEQDQSCVSNYSRGSKGNIETTSKNSNERIQDFKNSDQDLKTQSANEDKLTNSDAFGKSSEVQKFKVKPSLGASSHFQTLSASSNLFGVTKSDKKKIIEKKQVQRNWNEDDYLIKETTTTIRYLDGTSQDFTERHSILRENSSIIKQGSVHR